MIINNDIIQNDKLYYNEHRAEIQEALSGKTGIIQEISLSAKEDIFYMLCFCLCVPQSKAVLVDKGIIRLKDKNFFTADLSALDICNEIKGFVRFHNRKSEYLYKVKADFENIFIYLSSINKEYLGKNYLYLTHPLHAVRARLCNIIKGMSMKSSSHFLRNIGLRGLAIIDVHVMDGLSKRKLIPTDFKLNKKNYLLIEKIMIDYSSQLGIELDELDLMFWSQKTGYVFK